MKGTILDFLKLAAERPELAKELVELATKYNFEFTDEVSDEELDAVAGGATSWGTEQQIAAELVDEAKDDIESAAEQFKLSQALLVETQQRQQQAAQKISST